MGHVSQDCPQPKKDRAKCSVCGWFGKHHVNCTNNKTIANRTQNVMYVEEEQKSLGDNQFNHTER